MRVANPAILLAFLAVLVAYPATARAQGNPPAWTPPSNLFETEGRASEAEVVADPFGAVHVFWAYGAPDAEEEGWGQAIYYTRLHDGVWSEPVDVLVSPGGRPARMPSAAADSDGVLHVVWSGGNALFYSRAYAPEAGAAMAWTTPEALAIGVAASEPAVAVGPDDALFAIWSQARAGLIFARSDDGGQNWSAPQVIYQADRDNELARWGRIAVDGAGRIHAVLTYTVDDPTANAGRITNLLYYLRSDDQGATWTEPRLMTPEPDFGEISVATFGEDTVHVVWNGRAGRHGRYHRWSQDGGEAWSAIDEVIAPAPANPIGNGGLTGFPALATDADGALHMVTTAVQGNFYLRWQDGVWTSPVLITPGLDGNGVTRTANSLEQPSIAISQGDQLHAVFHDGFERIWHTSRQIDAPYQPPQAAPTRAPASAAEPTAGPATPVTASPTPAPSLPVAAQAPPPATSPSYVPILAGVAPAVLLIGVVVLMVGARRRQ